MDILLFLSDHKWYSHNELKKHCDDEWLGNFFITTKEGKIMKTEEFAAEFEKRVKYMSRLDKISYDLWVGLCCWSQFWTDKQEEQYQLENANK